MDVCAVGRVTPVRLDELGEQFRRYRLRVPAADPDVQTWAGDLVVRVMPAGPVGAGEATFTLYDGTRLRWTGQTLEVARRTPKDYLYEYVALPLPVGGGEPTQISLDPRAVWGDTPVTGVRVGPDGVDRIICPATPPIRCRSVLDLGRVRPARYSRRRLSW